MNIPILSHGLRVRVLAMSSAVFVACAACSHPVPDSPPPNFVVIYTDDMNFEDLGHHNEGVRTPNIDELAAQGTVFSRYYASAPVCTPSRYGLLTGRNASRSTTLMERYDTSEPAFLRWNTHIQQGDPTLPGLLSKHGYATGMVGKYHNLDNEPIQRNCTRLDPRTPEGRACVTANYARMVDTVRRVSGFDSVDRLYANNLHALGLPLELRHHNMEWVAEGALEFIEANRERPFFLYVATTIPHGPPPVESMKASPLITPAGWLDRVPEAGVDRRAILDEVRAQGMEESAAVHAWLDAAVGEIVDALREAGVLENTMILFASDHSGAFGGRGKMTNYEGGVRTPAFIWWPGRALAGRVTEALAANIDFAPTILDAAGIALPEEHVMDGVSLLPLVRGETESVRESVFLEITYSRGVVTDRYKYLATRFPSHVERQMTPLTRDQWNQEGLQATSDTLHGVSRTRYNAHELYPGYFDPDQLYDLTADPDEQVNLAGDPAYIDILAGMKEQLRGYLSGFPHRFGEFTLPEGEPASRPE